jgi:hypothetical protein
MKLYNTVKSLILEVASVNSVVTAIKNKDKVVIYYDGDEPGGRGLRDIEPVCFGYSKAGNPILRAWDSEGASHTGYKGEQPLPGWRIFRLDKINSFRPTGEKFTEPKPGYNPRGDKSMTRVIINAVFGNQQPTQPADVMNNVINSVVSQMMNDLRNNGGLEGVDLSKAAETYKRIYSGIESEIKRKLTPEEKNSLRTQIATTINNLNR